MSAKPRPETRKAEHLLSDDALRGVFERVFRHSPMTMLVSRVSDGVVLYAQDPNNRLPADPVGRTSHELGIWANDASRIDIANNARAPSGHFRRADWVDASGMQRAQYRFSKVFEVDGEELFAGGAFDIDELRDMESLLEETTRRLRRAQRIARVGDFVWYLDRNLFSGSHECYRLLGIDEPDTLVPIESALVNVHPDDRARLGDILAQANKAPESLEFEHRVLLPDGNVRHLHVISTRDVAADADTIRGTVQDLTERIEAQEERARIAARMQESQKLESLGLLAGGVAHDFNNLLSGILGNADLALLDRNDPDAMVERLGDIVEATQRAADLTRQLLAYSGKGRFIIKPVDMTDLVADMAQLLEVSVSGNTVLRTELASDVAAVEVDATQIRQVIMNLIINATEAVRHDRGQVVVRTGQRICDAGFFDRLRPHAACEPGRYVFVEVADNGSGMDPDTAARMFEPFFTTKFTGRGLGMAAVLGIVSGHGGAIDVQSAVGEGTTIRVFLPASDAAAESRADLSRTAAVEDTGTVLVIDDDQAVLNLACRVLERFGFETCAASGGAEGIERFRERADDITLVLLDLTMPGMDGERVFSALRALRPDVRVVLMSGYDETDATRRFDGTDLAGFLAKPFLVDDLIACLHDALRDRESRLLA